MDNVDLQGLRNLTGGEIKSWQSFYSKEIVSRKLQEARTIAFIDITNRRREIEVKHIKAMVLDEIYPQLPTKEQKHEARKTAYFIGPPGSKNVDNLLTFINSIPHRYE